MPTRVRVISRESRQRFVLRWTDPRTGKTKERQSKATVRRQAEREAKKLEADLASLDVPATDWAGFKIRHQREHCNGKPNASWRAVIKRIEASGPIKCASDITSSRISRVVAAMREEGLSDQTIRGYLKHLKAGLNWGIRVGLVGSMPDMRIPRDRRKPRARPVTLEEFERMVAYAAKVDPPLVDVMHAAFHAGIRRSEFHRVTADRNGGFVIDLDYSPPVMRIRADSQKNGKHQVIPLATELVGWLSKLPRKGRLFRTKQRRADTLGKAVARIGAACGIVVNGEGKTATLHDLRRSFGTRLATVRGLAPAELMVMMRHSRIEETMDYYVQIELESLASKLNPAAKMSDQIGDHFSEPKPNCQ